MTVQPGADGTPAATTPAPAAGAAATTPNPGDSGTTPPAPGAAPAADDSGWDDKTKAYIKSLRDENAKTRTKAKEAADQLAALTAKLGTLEGGLKKALGIEDPNTTPEERAKSLTDENASLAFQSAVLESAMEHGIPKAQLGYFKYLIGEKAASLAEDAELSDEDMTQIVAQVKAVGGVKPPAATSVTATPAGGQTPAPGSSGAITAEQFAKMGLMERSELFGKDAATYQRLMDESRAKKLI